MRSRTLQPFKWAFLTCALISLSSCTEMATRNAQRGLAERCEARGENMRIIPDEPVKEKGLLGYVSASGNCLAPGEEGYEDAMTIEEYRAQQ